MVNKNMKKKKGEEAKPISETLPETMKIVAARDIALDFATKTYSKFEQLIKTIAMFGSSVKKEATNSSDIDVVIIIDDVSLGWDEELIATYREELGKIIQLNPYRKPLHVNTIKLSTWWQDLIRGDPVVINVIRYGDPLIDHAGFFMPLKALLRDGKIRATPEAIYTLLQRTPMHMARARNALLEAVDGYYWACVDSAHAALIAAKVLPPSPEHVGDIMHDTFVKNKILKSEYVDFYNQIHSLAKGIVHGDRRDVSASILEDLRKKTDDFVRVMSKLVEDLVEKEN